MPIPLAPKSPSPRMRSPSVITITLTSRRPCSAQCASRCSIIERCDPALGSPARMVIPYVSMGSRWYFWHASPTVGVYRYGIISDVWLIKAR